MIALTTADHIETLARRLFWRDHPERAWRREAAYRDLPDDGNSASIEERALYREFAMGRISEESRGR